MPHTLHYGSPSQTLVDQAVSNFTGAKYSRLSFCTTPVEVLSLDGLQTVMTHGSGFFWSGNGVDWVITCWHVISGRDPFTLDFLDTRDKLIPQKIRVYGWKIQKIDTDIEFKRSQWVVDIPDAARALLAKPVEVDGQIVDIVAIPVPSGFPLENGLAGGPSEKLGNLQACLNLQNFNKINTAAGDDCVLIGYPLKNYSGLNLPIWKSGSISTDTNMTIDGCPAFLIDAASSSAMSGCPVLRRSAALPSVDKATGIITEHRGYEMIGVYAGRLQNQELERINVGYAWFASLIPKAIEASIAIWKVGIEELRRDSTSNPEASH